MGNCNRKTFFLSLTVLFCIFFLGTFYFIHHTFAASSTWTGTISTDWGTAGNWSLNAVPDSSTDVIIPNAGATPNDPSVSTNAICENLTINVNGVLNGNGNTITVYGDWTNNGTFNHGSGKVMFGGSNSAASTFIPGLSAYNNIEINRTNSVQTYDKVVVSGTVTALGNLIHTDGRFLSGQIDLSGNYIIGAAASGAYDDYIATIINLNGSNNQTIIYNTGGIGAQVRIDKAGGTFSISDDIKVSGWEYIQGAVTGMDVHTLTFGASGLGTFTPGSLVYGNIAINNAGVSNFDRIDLSGAATVLGNLTHTDGRFLGGQINLSGNYIIGTNASGSLDDYTATTVNFNSSDNQTITYASGGVGAQIRISKAGGTFSISSDIAVSGWEYVTGNVTGLNTHALILGGRGLGTFIPGDFTYGNIQINDTGVGNFDAIIVLGNLNISGNLTLTDGKLDFGTNNSSANLAGNLTISPSAGYIKGTGMITFNGTSPSVFTDQTTAVQNLGRVVVNKTSTTDSNNKLTLASDLTCDTMVVDGTAGQSDTLDMGSSGYVLSLANSGNSADVFTPSGTVVSNNSTIKYTATNSIGNINIAPIVYGSLQLSGNETYVLAGTATADNNLIIDANSVLNAGGSSLILNGNFINSGTFVPNTRSVILSGANQALFGNISFYNLTKVTASSDILTFGASSVITINSHGSLILAGADINHQLSLRSSVPGTRWNLNLNSTASFDLNYLDIQNSNASGQTSHAYYSHDSGNNANWIISAGSAPSPSQVSVETSHWNSNTYGNLNTITSLENITFSVSYDKKGDVKWYKDGTLVKTDGNVLISEYTAAWNASDYSQIKEIKATSTNAVGISADTIWKVEVEELGNAIIASRSDSPVNGIVNLYITNGRTNLPSLYLFNKQEDNALVEYLQARTYIVKKPIWIEGATFDMDVSTATDVYMQALPAISSGQTATEILVSGNGTINIDGVNLYGWDTANSKEIMVTDVSPSIQSSGNNQMNISHSHLRHVVVFYNNDQSGGDMVDSNTFFEGNEVNLSTADSKGQVITNNTFFYGLNQNYLGRGDSTGTSIEGNKFFALPGSDGGNVIAPTGAFFSDNEVAQSSWNLIEVPSNTLLKNNNLHDNGGHHNGFNGSFAYSYLVNDYCHDLTNYSCFYLQVNQHGNEYSDPATWTWPNHIYIFNNYIKDSASGIASFGASDVYVYNHTSDNVLYNENQMGVDRIVYRKSNFLKTATPEGSSLDLNNFNPPLYGQSHNMYVIDSQFAEKETLDYTVQSLPQYSGNPVIWSINSYRKNDDGTIALPAQRVNGDSTWGGEVRNYAYADVLAQDSSGQPIQGATITITPLTDTNYPAVSVLLPPPPPDLNAYPSEVLPIPDTQSFDSVQTRADGHTPAPNYGWSQNVENTPALLFYKTNSWNRVTSNYQYRITATYNSQTVYKDVILDATWLREDPNIASKTVILTFDKDISKIVLNVNSGTGSGLYAIGQTVNITANSAPSGKVFDRWIGDITGITNINSASTAVTIPSTDISISPYYKDVTYHLTVVGGTGTGDYPAGKITVVDAVENNGNLHFDYWTGTGASSVTHPDIYSSTLVMPTSNITVNATYSNIPTVSTPTFSPSGSTYSSSRDVSIITSTSGASIYYTTNGTNPTISSTHYTASFAISSTTTVKAIAVKTDYVNSAIASAIYIINIPSGGGGGGSSSGGGGGGTTTTALTPVIVKTEIKSIAGNLLTLNLSVTNASQMMLSDTSSFLGSNWINYTNNPTYTKQPLQTKLYLKFKSSTDIISSTVELTIPTTITNPSSGGDTPTPYPTGTLLKLPDSFKVYVIIDNKKKWIPTPEVFEQLGYKWTDIKILTPTELNNIPDFEDNLIRAINDYKVYLVVNGVKRHIPNPIIFLDYGFKWEEVKDVPQSTIDKYKPTYLIKQSNTNGIYYVNPQEIRKLIPSTEVFNSYNDKTEDIQIISKTEMDFYPLSNLIKLNGSNDIYLIEGNIKKRIPSPQVFNKYKLNWNLVMSVNQTEFNFYSDGGELK